MRKARRLSVFLVILLASSTFCAAQKVRYFKAEHGVGATYVKLASDGRYKVIDREHMGVFLTDEGRWQQTGDVISFSPTNLKNPPYQATEIRYKSYVFLAIASADAAAGIVIASKDTKRDLDTDPKHLPDHVLFKITAQTYNRETKQRTRFATSGSSLDDSRSRLTGVTSPFHSSCGVAFPRRRKSATTKPTNAQTAVRKGGRAKSKTPAGGPPTIPSRSTRSLTRKYPTTPPTMPAANPTAAAVPTVGIPPS